MSIDADTIIHEKDNWAMKRKKQKTRPTGKNASGPLNTNAASEEGSSRRDFLRKVRNRSVLALVLGGGGWLVVDDVRATMHEGDLSRIGTGVPTVVQIHDPQCPLCSALQREARDAMSDFEPDQLQFIVANIRGEAGRKFATSHGVGHVTLLLLDGKGKRSEVLTGPNTSGYLKAVFQRHVQRHGDS